MSIPGVAYTRLSTDRSGFIFVYLIPPPRLLPLFFLFFFLPPLLGIGYHAVSMQVVGLIEIGGGGGGGSGRPESYGGEKLCVVVVAVATAARQ